MKGYGKDGSDYEKTKPSDTDAPSRIKGLAESKELIRGAVSLVGNRRMRRDKKDGRSMER
jgi:hypothetical protein